MKLLITSIPVVIGFAWRCKLEAVVTTAKALQQTFKFNRYGYICLIFSASLSFAGQGEWKEVSSKSEVAVTPFGIKKILNHWEYKNLFSELKQKTITEILVGEDPEVLNKVTVKTTTYKWEGETVCQPNDPRLTLKTHSYSICWEVQGKMCEANAIASLAGDPCGKF